MTYCISSALKRYESGTATRLHLRARVDRGEHLERVRSAPHEPFARRAPGREQAVAEPVHQRVELGERGRRRASRRRSRRRRPRPCRARSARGRRGHRAVRSSGRSVRGAGSVPPVARSFAVRGVVEGVLRHAVDARRPPRGHLVPRGARHERLRVRAEGRRPAPGRVARALRRRASCGSSASSPAHGATNGVRFGFAISPGLDIDYESGADRATLLAQARAAARRGRHVVPAAARRHPDAARARAAPGRRSVTWLARLRSTAPTLTMCPTEYVGTRPVAVPRRSRAPACPPDVDIMWTGPTVCSPELRGRRRARAGRTALGDRRVVVWDNYPVNDALMTASLHLGPYAGRDAGAGRRRRRRACATR